MDDKLIDFLCSCPEDSETGTELLPFPASDIECGACDNKRATDSLLAGRWAYPIFCGSCDRWYFGGSTSSPGSTRAEHELRICERLAQALRAREKMESGQLGSILASLRSQIQYGGVERRTQSRSFRSKPVITAPLSADGEILAPATSATLIDYSPDGLSFLGRAIPKSPYFLIDLSLGEIDRVQLICKAVWCDEVAEYAKYGCQTLLDMSEL